MVPLDQDLQKVKQSFDQFGEITHRVLQYLPHVLSNSAVKNDYTIFTSLNVCTTKYVRPINNNLFLTKPEDFEKCYIELKIIFEKIKFNQKINQSEKDCIDKTLYTIQ